MNVKASNEFTRNLKKLIRKDYRLIEELEALAANLKENPTIGTNLGNGRYKIRVKNNSNNKGKSSGYRVVTYTQIQDTILLVYIYSKSDTENISDNKIDDIIRSYNI